MRLRKGAVKRRTIRGTERHRGVLLKKKAGLGSVRLAYDIVFTQLRATVEAVKILGVPV